MQIKSLLTPNIKIIIPIVAISLISVTFYKIHSPLPKAGQVNYDILLPEKWHHPYKKLSLFENQSIPTLLSVKDQQTFVDALNNLKQQRYINQLKHYKLKHYLMTLYDLPEKEVELILRSASLNANRYNLDTELILAIVFVESSYNRVARSNRGALGLMQVVPKWHIDKINQYGGVDVLFDISTNIHIGTEILAEYLEKENDLATALMRYNGSLNDKTQRYPTRVLEKYEYLKKLTHLDSLLIPESFDIVSVE